MTEGPNLELVSVLVLILVASYATGADLGLVRVRQAEVAEMAEVAGLDTACSVAAAVNDAWKMAAAISS